MVEISNNQACNCKRPEKNQNISHEICDSDLLFNIQNKQKIVDEKIKLDHEALFKKRIWRIRDIAAFLECSVGHIYNLSSRDLIPKRKIGKFLIFDPNEVLEWIFQGEYCEQK